MTKPPPAWRSLPVWSFRERARFSDLELANRRDELFYREFLRAWPGAEVLVLSCGPGLLVPLLTHTGHRARFEDLEPAMIDLTESEIRRCGAVQRIDAATADIFNSSDDPRLFDLAIVPREGLQLHRADDQLRALKALRSRLKVGGALLADCAPLRGRPSCHEDRPKYLHGASTKASVRWDFTRTVGGRSLTRWRYTQPTREGVRINLIYAFEEGGMRHLGRTLLTLYEVAAFPGHSETGLSMSQSYGDYSGASFDDLSPKQILHFEAR